MLPKNPNLRGGVVGGAILVTKVEKAHVNSKNNSYSRFLLKQYASKKKTAHRHRVARQT